MKEWPKVLTIGVYGFSEAAFFEKLEQAKVDAFCDVRARRGVRGSQYAFANSQRLQARLSEMGIRYVHAKDLAPSTATRQAQYAEDARLGKGKRSRDELGLAFIQSYEQERLTGFESDAFLRAHFDESSAVVFFCVERTPRACHRSLLTDRLADDLGVEVEHLVP